MMMFARYDANGRYTWYGNAGVDTDLTQPGIYVGLVDIFKQYHDVGTNQPVDMPEKPTTYHVFDYVTKQWVDPRTPQTEWVVVRQKRNQLLQESDWTQLPDVPLTDKNQWAIYRQALRDVTEQPDPFNITWPVPPT